MQVTKFFPLLLCVLLSVFAGNTKAIARKDAKEDARAAKRKKLSGR